MIIFICKHYQIYHIEVKFHIEEVLNNYANMCLDVSSK